MILWLKASHPLGLSSRSLRVPLNKWLHTQGPHIERSCPDIGLNWFWTIQRIPDSQKWRTAQKTGTFTSPWSTGRDLWGVLSYYIRSIIWQTPLSSMNVGLVLVFPHLCWLPDQLPDTPGYSSEQEAHAGELGCGGAHHCLLWILNHTLLLRGGIFCFATYELQHRWIHGCPRRWPGIVP